LLFATPTSKSPRMKTHQYRLVLYENASPMEYDGDEIFTFSYLRTRFQSEAAAKQILDDLAEAVVAVDRLPLYNLRRAHVAFAATAVIGNPSARCPSVTG
jgi:hypothetical protein